MILICARNKVKITDDAKLCVNFFDRLLGLINPKNPKYLVLFTRFGIHTVFLHVYIDVVILDENNQIRAMKQQLRPFSFFFYNPKFYKVVEMPSGEIEKTCLHIGDKILFE